MRGWMGLGVFVGLVLGMAPTPSMALEPVYRCQVKGVPTFVSTPVKGHRCRSVKHAPPPPTPLLPPAPLPSPKSAPPPVGSDALMPPPSATPTRGSVSYTHLTLPTTPYV